MQCNNTHVYRDQEEGGGAGPSSQPRRDHEQGGGAGLRKLDFFRFGLFLNSSATDIVLVSLPSTAVETAVVQCTSHCAMARGHRLNTSVVLAAVHGLSGLFRAVSAVEPSLSRPPPSPQSLISNFASVGVKQYGQWHGQGPRRSAKLKGLVTCLTPVIVDIYEAPVLQSYSTAI